MKTQAPRKTRHTRSKLIPAALATLAPLALQACTAPQAGHTTPSQAIGPVIKGKYADPNIARFGDTYYIYPTTDGQKWMSTYFKCFSSKDLEHWTDEGIILDLADVSWAESKAWAPTIAEANGKYYFYFTAQDRIGVAVSDAPTGPFKDALGKPLIENGIYDTYEIDPAAFKDTNGAHYLYFGNGRCYAIRLNNDMISLDTATAKDITPRGETTEFREGVFVFKRGDTYHLTWSVNDTRSPDYQVHAATGPTPFGPFTLQTNNPILFRDGVSLGTAHHSVVENPDGSFAICFHRFAVPGGDGMNRETCIAPLTFDAQDNIERVDISALRTTSE